MTALRGETLITQQNKKIHRHPQCMNYYFNCLYKKRGSHEPLRMRGVCYAIGNPIVNPKNERLNVHVAGVIRLVPAPCLNNVT